MSSLITQCCMDAEKNALCPDPSFHIFVMQDRALVETADSLIAIKKPVFDEKKLTMDELIGAIDANFEGTRGEQIRRTCLAEPKFGNDIDEIDSTVRELGKITAGVIGSCNRRTIDGWWTGVINRVCPHRLVSLCIRFQWVCRTPVHECRSRVQRSLLETRGP